MTPFTTTIELLLPDSELVEVSCDVSITWGKEHGETDTIRLVQAKITRGNLLHPTGQDITNLINTNDELFDEAFTAIMDAYAVAKERAEELDDEDTIDDSDRDMADFENDIINRDQPL